MLWPNGSKTRPNVTSGYGPRKAPTAGASTFHKGTDFTGFALVRSIEPGVVVAVGVVRYWEGGGNQVWVQHDGYLARYFHMKNTPVVRLGERVTEGRILGAMGMTGTASGVHLHVEIVVNGVQLDPVPFITARLGSTASGGNASEEDDMFTDQDRANLTSVMLALGASDLNVANEPGVRTAIKILQSADGQVNGLPDALKAIMGQVNGVPEVLAEIRARVGISTEQVKTIAGAIAKQLGTTPAMTIDYAAIAKAVNDDVARRMTS